MSAELDAVDSARRSDLQRAARALLRRPVLQAGGATAEQFLLVRRRAEELREWFGRNTGWRLHVEYRATALRHPDAVVAGIPAAALDAGTVADLPHQAHAAARLHGAARFRGVLMRFAGNLFGQRAGRGAGNGEQ